MSEREVQAAIDEIAAALGTGVSLDDLAGQLVAYSVQKGTVDQARVRTLLNREVPEDIRAWQARHVDDAAVGPTVIPANDDLHMQARICIPLIHRGVRTGLLYLIDPMAGDEPSRVAETVGSITDHVELLAILLYEMASPDLDERHQREVEFFAACHGDAAALTGFTARTPGRSVTSMCLAVSVYADEHGLTELSAARASQARLVRRQTLLRYPPVIASSVQDTHTVVLLRADHEPNPALRLHQRLGACQADAARERVYTGVAENFSALTELPEVYRHAVVAAQSAAIEPEFGTIASWETIGPYRIIGTRLRTDGTVSELLETLVRADPGGELLDTLEMFYDHQDNIRSVADALHLHRTSLYYRLNKIRDITGVDPLTGAARLELHLALKARRWNRRPHLATENCRTADSTNVGSGTPISRHCSDDRPGLRN